MEIRLAGMRIKVEKYLNQPFIFTARSMNGDVLFVIEFSLV
jgi:hypothetical protein